MVCHYVTNAQLSSILVRLHNKNIISREHEMYLSQLSYDLPLVYVDTIHMDHGLCSIPMVVSLYDAIHVQQIHTKHLKRSNSTIQSRKIGSIT